MAYTCSEKEAKLQKKLIPLNIAVCIICLVASISLLVAPFISIDMGKLFTAITEVVEEGNYAQPEYVLYTETLEKENSGGNSGSSAEQIDPAKLMKKFAKSMEGVSFSLSTVRLGKMAAADDVIYEMLSQVVDDLSDVITDTLIEVAIPIIIQESGVELTEEQVNTAIEKINELENVQNRSEAETKFGDLLDTVAEIGGEELTDEARAEIVAKFGDMYDSTVSATGGEFDVEKLLCVYVSENVFELETPVTSYEEVLRMLIEKGDQISTVGAHTYSTASDGGMSDTMDEVMKIIRLASLISFLSMFVFVLIWFIQAVFALAHIFVANKRFTMWYTKIWGFWPCFAFGVAPLIGRAVISSVAGATSPIVGIMGAISSLTWISGACYLLLWAFSIFWAFPIKRRIKILRKEEAAERAKAAAQRAAAQESGYADNSYNPAYDSQPYSQPADNGYYGAQNGYQPPVNSGYSDPATGYYGSTHSGDDDPTEGYYEPDGGL